MMFFFPIYIPYTSHPRNDGAHYVNQRYRSTYLGSSWYARAKFARAFSGMKLVPWKEQGT